VASIKPANPDTRGMNFTFVPGGGLKLSNVDLKQMIGFAYDVQNFQISGGPSWLTSDRFDVQARPPASDGPSDLLQMTEDQRKLVQQQMRQRLQALLAERFKLAVHKETKELPVYALVLAKNGPKLKQSQDQKGPMHIAMERGQLNGQQCSMETLAKVLSPRLARSVLDRTGLKGNYDFNLEWTPDPGEPMGRGGPGEGPPATPPADLSGPSIFTAVQEQLGLKLEPQKGPVEIIVVDGAEKPSAN